MMSEQCQDTYSSFDDIQIWKALKQGDLGAFEYLYQRYIQVLFDYGMHIHNDSDLIKDAIQELFIHIWQRRNSLGNVKNIRNYLIVSFRRFVIAQLETRKKWSSATLKKINQLVEVDASPENHMIAHEIYVQQENDLMEAIEKLPDRQREIVYLLFYKKIPQKEIAKIMAINLESVYTLTSKAIKNLRKQLKKL